MLKVLLVVAVLIAGATVYVAVQNQRAAEQAIHQAHHNEEAAPPSIGHQKPEENKENSERNSPSWFGLFAWPDSTTTWAILLTLWAITWQAVETRKASEASRDSIRFLLAKDRARLELNVLFAQLREDPTTSHAPVPLVEFGISNLGPTHAFYCRLFAAYAESPSESPVALPLMEEVRTRPTMKAESRDCRPDLSMNLTDPDGIIEGRVFLQVGARLTYTDVFGEERETAIRRVLVDRKWEKQGSEKENYET